VYYAVKQLLKQDDAPEDPRHEPDRETTAYKYLNSKRHPHIIQLLATFTQKGHLNMIFPWANGNLMDLWQHHFPRATDPARNEDLARWLIRQCLGLAQAIHCIHHSSIADHAEQEIGSQDPAKTHGRHGDLKPENILWFKDISTTIQYSHGNLLISDLGSTEFHATRSKTIQADAAGGHTHTYKAPEFDIKQKVAPKADIWSFGCVLLEFIVWYMYGWEGVKGFAKARSKESNLQIRGDHFFNFDQHDSTVLVKASVRKVCMSAVHACAEYTLTKQLAM
jgi:serine/threonine protein kinase